MAEIIGFVVVAGHLDIEWYQPLRSYRFWTVEALEQLKVIASRRPDFKNYVLDGQYFPLEEYLDVVPGDRQAMQDLISAGKLSIGPFYTQFDEWLPSAEAMIRNCLYGNRLSSQFGSCMKAGYLPDNFGHPLQMPQILNNFGIDSLLFMRGLPEIAGGHPDEFIIEGPDGSRVLASHFRESYGGAFDLFHNKIDPIQPRDVPYYPGYLSYEWHLELAGHDDPDRIARNLIDNVRQIKNRYPSGVIPLIAGFDHLPPQINIGASINKANTIQNEVKFITGDVAAYIDLVRERLADPMILKEELLGSVYQFVLLGALSTRTYLKQKHFAAEILLEKYAEPLLALGGALGYAGKPALMHEAWRNVMINSAHDSIHGSSVDEVHVEMEARYAAVCQIAAGVIHDVLKFAGSHVRRWWEKPDRGIVAFAPLASSVPQIAELWLPVGDQPGAVFDEKGQKLPTQVLAREEPARNGLGQIRDSGFPDEIYRQVLFADSLNCQQVKTYAWRETASLAAEGLVAAADREQSGLAAGSQYLDNGLLRVEINGALINILDRRTGRQFCNLNLLEEEADAGDAWDYSPAWVPGEVVRSSRFFWQSSLAEKGPLRQTISLQGQMSVPGCLIGDLRSEARIALPVSFSISLLNQVPRVDVRLILDNQARDHRIRLRVPTGTKTRTILSQGHLAIISRPVEPPAHVLAWRQPPTRLFPFREWLAAQDGEAGLALAVKGLYDYEAIMNPLTGEPDICITLLRGIGKMTRENMMQRTERASDAFETPGAQCLGRQSFEWSYMPYAADCGNLAPFQPVADAWFCPPVAHAIRSVQRDDQLADLSHLCRSLTGHIRLSACKPAYDDQALILRFYENQGQHDKISLDVSDFGTVSLSDMNESAGPDLPVTDNQVVLEIKPYQALTLKLNRAGRL